jgi:Molybdopterin-binding domain of aldehyde dehydrogenase
VTEIRRVYALDDCGTRINPTIIEGQVHGGLTEALAIAMGQEMDYDTDGNLRNPSPLDFSCRPRSRPRPGKPATPRPPRRIIRSAPKASANHLMSGACPLSRMRSRRKVTPIGGFFVAIFGLFGYLISAERGERQPFLDKQLDSCAALAKSVGTLASAEVGLSSWNRARQSFKEYYWGGIVVFEDTTLKKRLEQFNKLLSHNDAIYYGPGARGGYTDLHEAAGCVANTCKAQAHVSWSVVPGLLRDEIDDNSCSALEKAAS